MLRFGISVNVMRLSVGRRSLYVAVEFGRRTAWLQRWDGARDPRPRLHEPGTGMTWSWGVR